MVGGPNYTRGAKGEVSLQGTWQDVLGIFLGFSLNYKESGGSSYTQAKKKLWKPDRWIKFDQTKSF